MGSGGTLTVAHSLLTDNRAKGSTQALGGGIYATGVLALSDSTVEGNKLSYDEQVAKLRLIVEVAAEVWG